MRRILCCIFVLFFVFPLTSCGANAESIGTDIVGTGSSNLGVAILLPKNKKGNFYYGKYSEFNDVFQSVEENAFHQYKGGSLIFGEHELVLVYFKYDDETYEKAKEYTIKNEQVPITEPFFSNGNYTFFDIKPKGIDSKRIEDGEGMFFAYNDESNTLIFLGSYLSGILYGSEARLVKTDFEKYLSLFSKYYDFSK